MKHLNNVGFSNPTTTQQQHAAQECIVSDLFEEFTDYGYADNDSALTRAELETVRARLDDISLEANKTHRLAYVGMNRNVEQTIISKFHEKGLDVSRVVTDITEDVSPLIMRLAWYYNRPRPAQLGQVFEIDIFPLGSPATTPSYPSRNAALALVVLGVLCNHHPEHAEMANRLSADILNSQIYLGQHYATDNDFASDIASAILKHHKFNRKHKI